jgi:molybdopterin synthase sulfur carrier subunit
MKLVYFACDRERIGVPEEEFELPHGVSTSGVLIDCLGGRGENYAYALERPDVIRVAIDKAHARHDAPLAGAREVALFPPMTGG